MDEDTTGLLEPTQTPLSQWPPLDELLSEPDEPLLEEPEPLPEEELELELGLPGHVAGQLHDGVHELFDDPLPWQTLPASAGTVGHWSTPSRMATPIPPEK